MSVQAGVGWVRGGAQQEAGEIQGSLLVLPVLLSASCRVACARHEIDRCWRVGWVWGGFPRRLGDWQDGRYSC